MNPNPAQPKPLPDAPPSFTFRLWQTCDAQGDSAWRGKLQLVTTGQVRYLNDLQSVTAQLRELLRELEVEADLREENHVS